MVTLDYQVLASADDGCWFTVDSFDNTMEVLSVGVSVSDILNLFARFVGVTIPVGAFITAAHISTYYETKYGTPPACELYFEKASDPTAPTTTANANARTKTTAHISWTPPSSGTWADSNDISEIIQELVNAYNYSAGKHMQLLVMGGGTGSNIGSVRSYNSSWGNSFGIKLHIEYVLPGGNPRAQMIGPLW
jgi:hypothetical protein